VGQQELAFEIARAPPQLIAAVKNRGCFRRGRAASDGSRPAQSKRCWLKLLLQAAQSRRGLGEACRKWRVSRDVDPAGAGKVPNHPRGNKPGTGKARPRQPPQYAWNALRDRKRHPPQAASSRSRRLQSDPRRGQKPLRSAGHGRPYRIQAPGGQGSAGGVTLSANEGVVRAWPGSAWCLLELVGRKRIEDVGPFLYNPVFDPEMQFRLPITSPTKASGTG